MKLASIKRIQVQSLARKRKQDVMYSMHLKRQKLITKFADRSSIEAQAKDIEEKVVVIIRPTWKQYNQCNSIRTFIVCLYIDRLKG